MILMSMLFASPLIEVIPISVLTGLMFVVVYKTIYWKTVLLVNKMSYLELFIIVIVTALTIIYDLAIGVVVGVVI